MSALYDQIKQLTRTERLELVEKIWDGLAQEGDGGELSAAQAAELDKRLAQHWRDPQGGKSLEQIAAGLGVRPGSYRYALIALRARPINVPEV